MIARISAALREAMPGLDPVRFVLFLNVVFGAYAHPQVHGIRTALSVGIDFNTLDPGEMSSILADIICDGFAGLNQDQ